MYWTFKVSARKLGAIGIFYPVTFGPFFIETEDKAVARGVFFNRFHPADWEINNIIDAMPTLG